MGKEAGYRFKFGNVIIATFNRMSAKEIAQYGNLLNAAWPEEAGDGGLKRSLSQSRIVLFGMVKKGNAVTSVGFVRLQPISFDQADDDQSANCVLSSLELNGITTREDHKGQGYATEIVATLLKHAPRLMLEMAKASSEESLRMQQDEMIQVRGQGVPFTKDMLISALKSNWLRFTSEAEDQIIVDVVQAIATERNYRPAFIKERNVLIYVPDYEAFEFQCRPGGVMRTRQLLNVGDLRALFAHNGWEDKPGNQFELKSRFATASDFDQFVLTNVPGVQDQRAEEEETDQPCLQAVPDATTLRYHFK